MGKYYNEHYNYEDINMWSDESWADRGADMNPMLYAITARMEEYRKENPIPDYYADRTDMVRDSVHRCDYFPDLLEDWKNRGMEFTCSGMMGLTMAPLSVTIHQKRDPRVLYIPDFYDNTDPMFAMNLLKEYENVIETCAREEILVQFLPLPENIRAPYAEKMQETQGNYRITFDPVYLYLDLAIKAGFSMDEFPGKDIYKPIETVAGFTMIEITDKWQYRIAHQYIISRLYWDTVPEWDYDRHIRSAQGRYQAESMRLEYDYDHPTPALIERFKKMGLRYENHYTDQEFWVTLTPESAFTKPEHKLPVLCVFKEPRSSIPFFMLTAMQFYYNFIDIAARGEFMMLFFALEKPDDNDFLIEILKDAEARYPVDTSRIYLTGQSHNGYYALEFYRRHPDLVAAVATLADPIGLQVGATVTGYDKDEIIKSFAQHDMPLININGQLENKFRTVESGSELEKENAEHFRRRLKAFRCPDRSIEEIIAARRSDDYATRTNGIPADRSEVRYYMGNEVYISDLKNIDGNWHLRFVTLENMPHMIAPQMAELSWEFLRRFAREVKTGETIELYKVNL